MRTVGFWSIDGDITQSYSFTLVRYTEVDLFREAVVSGDIPAPERLFIVAQNGYGHEDFLGRYIEFVYLNETESKLQISESAETAHTFFQWGALVEALEKFDVSAALQALKAIQCLQHPVAGRTGEIIWVVEQYVLNCLLPISDHSWFPIHERHWWEQPLELIQKIDKLLDRVALKKPTIPEIKIFEDALTQLKRRLNAMLGKPIGGKFHDLSALCIGLAEKHLASNRIQSAFLLCYRALDIYFQSYALTSGVMMEVADGVAYKSAPGNRVYLVDTEYRLASERQLLSDSKRRDFIVRINRIRNEMLLTHGGQSISALDVKSFIDGARNLVKQVDGDARWIMSGEFFFPKFPNYQALVFASVADLHTYIEEATI